MKKPFPEYAKTSHPEVLATHRANIEAWGKFFEDARDLCEELTGRRDLLYFNGFSRHNTRATGLSHRDTRDIDLPGKWKKPDGNVIKPYKSNPIAKRFDELTFKADALPGRNWLEWGDHHMGPGALFEHDGHIYSRYGFTPRDDRPDDFDTYGWIEIKASEWHAAAEALKEATHD